MSLIPEQELSYRQAEQTQPDILVLVLMEYMHFSAGTLNINGGVENRGVWDLSNSSAVINASSSFLDLSNAILANSQNVSLNLDSHSLLIVSSGFDPGNYFLHYTNSGLVNRIGSPLDIPATSNIFGIGSINDHVYCEGSLSVPPGNSSINLNSGLTFSGTGQVNLGYSGGSLYINDSISGMNGGSIMASNQYVGFSGKGIFTQIGGTNFIDNIYIGYNSGSSGTYNLAGGAISGPTYLYLGYNSGSSGTCNLSGTGHLSSVNQYIGYSGTGTFTQIGCTSYINQFYLGYNTGSNGTYTLKDNGNISSGSTPGEFIGYSGNGTFSQTGGTNSIPAALYLGYNSSASGSYTLDGSGTLSTTAQFIGYSGSGTFTQTGGTNTPSTFPLYLGSNSGASGTYILSGNGNLSPNACDEYIGYSGTGTFNQTGGTNSISPDLYLGYYHGASGTYNLSDAGILSKAINEYIGYGGTGTFTQTGGTNATSSLYLGIGSSAQQHL